MGSYSLFAESFPMYEMINILLFVLRLFPTHRILTPEMKPFVSLQRNITNRDSHMMNVGDRLNANPYVDVVDRPKTLFTTTTYVLFNVLMYCVCILMMTHGKRSNEPTVFTSKVLPRSNNSNYFDFEGSTYYFNTEYETNFYESMRVCKQHNMELVSIESAAENDRIGLFLIERGLQSRRFWTSAVNMVDGGKWIWLSTGQYIKYFNWDAGEPTGIIPFVSSYENCIQARHEGNRGFTWNDLSCGKKNYAICEKPSVCSCSTVRNN